MPAQPPVRAAAPVSQVGAPASVVAEVKAATSRARAAFGPNARVVCYAAHLQDIGWQGWACGRDGEVVGVGTTGQSRRMEALGLQVGSGTVNAQAHVQDYGWLGWVGGNPVYAGTTGQSRRLEAIRITV
ncbi:hypothetical protein [Streptomyces sp. NPDC089919]|uniref:hypothetical protein n=1 Tax=Streptomyces sp. NPDC089919 TaxID=3155188 RepID=UPI0034330E9A